MQLGRADVLRHFTGFPMSGNRHHFYNVKIKLLRSNHRFVQLIRHTLAVLYHAICTIGRMAYTVAIFNRQLS